MKLTEFKAILKQNPEAHVRFRLPTNEFVAAHAHVTEAARIDKHFVDCGGTVRQETYCRLQTWVAGDVDHRLQAGKLDRILEKAAPLLKGDGMEVDIEHELEFIGQFPVEAADVTAGEVIFRLGVRHTACLAQDVCCPPQPLREFKPLSFNPVAA
jgi:hypothetical protein